ncbi:DUF2478 domain-containing protein [Shimia sediminis]|uniref:DUF2478 domain-containing protein n=1 Tax=Shimia sediminis TaxID=2497945 RepID=UPI000F8C9817|nr:DUF2478 domain-containing protein [Shimia sediminis]
MTYPLLAGIQFDVGDIDDLLAEVATTLSHDGYRVRGVLQSRGEVGRECHCADMDLHTIGETRTFRISQPLGNGSRGCRLHPGALAECAAYLETELDRGVDLLVLNRFGRGESKGSGFRDLICQAMVHGVPVLTAVRPTYQQEWVAFGQALTCNLPMNPNTILQWFDHTHGVQHAA